MGSALEARSLLPRRNICKRRLVQPHVLVFALLCILYFVPLWLVSISTYAAGGVLAVGEDAHRVGGQIAIIYLLGFSFFCLGSWSVPKLCWLLGATSKKNHYLAIIRIYPSDYVLFFIFSTAFVFSKLLLIPTGVYSNYAFDTGSMDSPIWTASMFFSESLVIASLIALFSKSRHNLLFFVTISILNGINLLHGTRNFMVVGILTAAMYVYSKTNTSFLKMILYGAATLIGAVGLAYAVFLTRTHIIDAGFTLLDILTPITFESVFSQMSLVSLLNHPILLSALGSPFHLIQDIAIFTTPRFLLKDKDTALWIAQFGYLSPLGAFNGFAAGLLYFGYLFPLFYYAIGLIAGVLYRWATNQYGAILYLYFTCDFLYRIMRDGYIIPLKMMINTLELITLIVVIRFLTRILMSRIHSNRVSGIMQDAS